MCVVQLEDVTGTIGVTIFPRAYEETAELWVEGTVVIVRGEVQVRRDEPGILCHSVKPVRAVEEEMNRKQYLVWLTSIESRASMERRNRCISVRCTSESSNWGRRIPE